MCDDTNIIDIVCYECGSNQVVLDAYAQWSVEAQDWELCSTYDEAYCTICDGQTRLKEVILRPTYLEVMK